MLRTMLKSKIHRAMLTGAELAYPGSLTVDSKLLEAADMLPGEKIQVVNCNNGSRLETYLIKGEAGSGEICLNGAAARMGLPGDIIIVISYGEYTEKELETYAPKVVLVNDDNSIKEVQNG